MAGQRVELPPYSAYTATPMYEVNGDLVFGLMRDAVVADESDDLYQVPSAGEFRLDRLSNHFYSTPELWWVLAAVNDMIDPLVGVPRGTIIRVPTRARLANEGILNI